MQKKKFLVLIKNICLSSLSFSHLISDYKKFTEDIINTVERSAINKNNWLWMENQKRKDGQTFLLENVQAYMKQLYDTEDDNLFPNMIQIGTQTLKYYPENVF